MVEQVVSFFWLISEVKQEHNWVPCVCVTVSVSDVDSVILCIIRMEITENIFMIDTANNMYSVPI